MIRDARWSLSGEKLAQKLEMNIVINKGTNSQTNDQCLINYAAQTEDIIKNVLLLLFL